MTPPAFGSLPFLNAYNAERPGIYPTAMLGYHQPAFFLLQEQLADDLRDALLTTPQALRARYLATHLPVGQEIAAEVAWPVVFEFLSVLEAEIARILRTRSVFFWMHIYRRIGITLSPRHEDKADARTVMLVRQVVELGIVKHGRATDADEAVLSSRVKPDLILGGFMRAGIKALFKSRFTKTYQQVIRDLRASPQWVIRDFTEEDVLNIYRVEGLAYQYWRATALLRALGKDTRIIVREDGDWDYAPNDELRWLIESIDERTEKERLAGSLLGIWFDDEIKRRHEKEQSSVVDLLVWPMYNAEKVSSAGLFRKLGLSIADDHIGNFIPVFLNVRAYLDAHRFLSDPLRRRYGCSLESFVTVLHAIASAMFFPRSMLLAKTEESRREVFRNTLLNLLQRGYGMFNIDREKAIAELIGRIEVLFPEVHVTEAEVGAVLDRLTLTPGAQPKISLWSGGPRHVLIPAGSQQVVDLQGVPTILSTLFVGVAYDQGHRGTVFEEAFRRAVRNRGFQVQSGRLFSTKGSSKELDVGVIIGEDLFVFECVSIERPLDYEIGRPATLERRRMRLDSKVQQVLELSEFLQANPRGANYDFAGVRRIVPLVVSPFVEWLWDRSERLWLPDGTPRILSTGEALELVEQARGRGAG